MILGFIKKATRNIHILCKNNSIVTQRVVACRYFTEFKSEKEKFLGIWPKVINDVTASAQITDIPEFANTMKQILDYNVTGGKYADGLSTILCYTYLEKPENITEASMESCRILGWCMEMVQAYWIVLDDIADKSVTRRGKTCWYMLPDVGVRAVNDSALIYGILLKFLQTNFQHLPQFPKIMEQFNDALIYTAAGQHLDYTMNFQKENNYMLFTPEIYDVIVKYKTSHYTHVIPVNLGMILANIDDMEIRKKVKEIGYKIGRLHQMQNDFADVFPLESDPDKLETVDPNLNMSELGTDIQEGKCSWLAVTALQHCNEAQREKFATYYGSANPTHLQEIKRLYEQLKLPEIYKQERRMRLGSNTSFTDFRHEKKIFHESLPKIIDTIVASPQFTEIPEFSKTLKQILDYNLIGGKCTRGLSTILTYKFLEKPENITEESLELSRILAWCVEMVQAYWTVLDDIADKSVTRRGKTCWYMLPDVEMRAVNDSALIYGTLFKFVQTKFRHLPQFPKIMEQFHDALIYTAAGQHLDYTMKFQKEKNYILFTDEIYDVMVKYKTSQYTHVIPITLGVILASIDDMEILRKVKEIGYKIGRLNQLQNDFADVFPLESIKLGTPDGNLNMTELGTDIQEGKCSWLAVTALQNCNEAQRRTFTEYYGSADPAHVQEIKRLYEQLKLSEIYRQEKSMLYDEITRLAQDFNSISRAPELFLELLRLTAGNK